MDIGPLHINRRSGRPVEHYGRRLTPEHLVIHLQFPGTQGGLIFNRPIAVRVEEQGQPPTLLPVINYTRLGQILLAGVGLLASFLFVTWRKS